jgi:putative component of toxin-antitoxin plasmid stabilization module
MSVAAVRIKHGATYEIYALEHDGHCDLREFLLELHRSNSIEFAKLVKDLDRTADSGIIRNPEKFKLLHDGIYEFKTHGGIRVLCFLDGRRIIVLTNGFMKKKKYDSDIQKAINLRVKYLDAQATNSLIYKEDEI